MKNGPIILIEDDMDDQEFIIDAIQTLGVKNEIKTFDNAPQAFEFLKSSDEQPFIIISDVNLPIVNGMQLKQEIQQNEFLKHKAIPFVFLTTSADPQAVREAFDLDVQGFFVKENTYEGIRQQLKQILDYWSGSKHPNNSDIY